jgi:hypothetical protein
LALLLVAAALTMLGAAQKPFWSDELWSLYYAGGAHYGPISPMETVQRVVGQSSHENNPPSYYLLLNLWGTLTGWSEFATRMLSAFAGVLAVALTYQAGRELARRIGITAHNVVGIGGAAALVGSAFFLYYAQEVRSYVFMVLLAALVMWAYLRLLRTPQPSALLQTTFVLGLAGLAYTHYLSLIVPMALAAYHVVAMPKDRRWWRVTGLAVLAGALFLPWLGNVLSAMSRVGAGYQGATLIPAEALYRLVVAFTTDQVWLFALLALYGLLGYGWRTWRVVLLVSASIASALLVNAVVPSLAQVRYLIALWPLLAILIGLGIARLAEARLNVAAALCLLLGIGVVNSLDPAFMRTQTDLYNGHRLPWPNFATTLRAHAQAEDKVFFHAPLSEGPQGRELTFYTHDLGLSAKLLEWIPGLPEGNDYVRRAGAEIGDAPRVWVGSDKTRVASFRLPDFQRALSATHDYCGPVYDLPDMRLDLYQSRALTSAGALPLRFGEGIVVRVQSSMGEDQRALLMVSFAIAPSVPRAAYSLAFHVEAEDEIGLNGGTLVAQIDDGLTEGAGNCRLYWLDLSRLPQGDYRLLGTVYQWQDGARLPGSFSGAGNVASTQAEDGRLLIGTFNTATNAAERFRPNVAAS